MAAVVAVTGIDVVGVLLMMIDMVDHMFRFGTSALHNTIKLFLEIERRIHMKIAIPTEEKTLESRVYASFGRTPYFLVYDTETKKSEFINNSAAANPGGAGIKAAQTVVDYKADVLLTPRCGQNAADVLKSAEIKIYQTTSASAKDNIADFINGKLPVLGEIHAGFQRHGGN